MTAPKFSIVTPSFNQSKFLEAAIVSVLRQGYPGVEHIVVDGGSTDSSLEVLKRHPHVKWTSEPDRGQSHALNKGFSAATGEFVGWLNSDDTYEPGAFALVEKAFSDPKVNVVYGDGHEIDEDGRITKPYKSRGVSFEGLLAYWKWEYEFVQPAFFFRRSALAADLRLDENLHYAMDYDLFVRLLRTERPCYIASPLANLRLHKESKTGKVYQRIVPEYIREMQKVSHRNWGKFPSASYLKWGVSFLGAIVLSIVKNVLFLPGSKMRSRVSGDPQSTGP